MKSYIILGLSLGGAVLSLVLTSWSIYSVDKAVQNSLEEQKPAIVNLTKITVKDCETCFSLDNAINQLKKQKVEVKAEKELVYDSPEAQEFIKNLSIIKVPTYLLTGEVKKKNLAAFISANGEVKNETFVFTKPIPVYLDPSTKKEFGKVEVTYIADESCSKCPDVTKIVSSFQKGGMKITKETKHDYKSQPGSDLIKKYQITKVPVFILSEGATYYENIKQGLVKIGKFEEDLTFVARELNPPYRELSSNKIVGLVDVIYLKDGSCSTCYQAEVIHKNVLSQNYAVGINSEKIVDIASPEGKSLVAKYKITRVPTIVLSPDIERYPMIKNIWGKLGTKEADGWYVMRELQGLNLTYKDLSTNQVVEAKQNE